MPRLIVNDDEHALENVPECWGELLNVLEQEADGRGEVVTMVRFEGVDEPTFRQQAQMDRRLNEMQLVEVRTFTPHDLIDDALAQGALAAETLASAAVVTAPAFRSADCGRAIPQLAEFGQGIHSLLSILGMVGALSTPGFAEMEKNGRALSSLLDELVRRYEVLVEAQRSQDWLTVADVLEYDLPPALRDCGALFKALRLGNVGSTLPAEARPLSPA